MGAPAPLLKTIPAGIAAGARAPRASPKSDPAEDHARRTGADVASRNSIGDCAFPGSDEGPPCALRIEKLCPRRARVSSRRPVPAPRSCGADPGPEVPVGAGTAAPPPSPDPTGPTGAAPLREASWRVRAFFHSLPCRRSILSLHAFEHSAETWYTLSLGACGFFPTNKRRI